MDIGPVTAQVATSSCQNIRQYMYFGTGRYFQPTDGITLPNENIFGVDITGCINSTSCTVTLTKITPSNQVNASYVPGFSWYMGLTDNGERNISDPSAQGSYVTFTTALPTGTSSSSNSLCVTGYGGQTNVWSLMCGTGSPNTNSSTYLISTSSGGIYAATTGGSNTTGKIGTFSGIPSVKKPAEVTSGTNKGIIIQWLEK
jgi:type IV pilus assembly protein PilY1